jgi:hypothetical protein
MCVEETNITEETEDTSHVMLMGSPHQCSQWNQDEKCLRNSKSVVASSVVSSFAENADANS